MSASSERIIVDEDVCSMRIPTITKENGIFNVRFRPRGDDSLNVTLLHGFARLIRREVSIG